MSTTIIEPRIIRETNAGFSFRTLADERLENRELEIAGEIDDALANSLISQLRYLERQDPSAEITVYVNSPGGVISSGLALYDALQAVRCPIRMVCQGCAASMAAVLFASGDRREMLPHATIMVHDPLVAGEGLTGSATFLESKVRNVMATRTLMAQILAKHTGRTLEEVYGKTMQDTYFNATEAIAFGLADAVLEHF